MRLISLLLIVFSLFVHAFAQQHIERQIQGLDKDFRSFKYKQVIEKGRFLLSDPYVTKKDSLQIYKYMLNAAYALADTNQAKTIIKQIIKCDPEFALNPKETSPKIIEFFEHVKNQIRHHTPLIPGQPEGPEFSPTYNILKPLPNISTAFSILLPGAGHLHQKFIGKGTWFTGISVALISGLGYSVVQTNERRKDYMGARDGANFDRLYKDYNRMYKIRNLLIGAYVLWDVYVLFDLQKSWEIRLETYGRNKTVSVRLSKHW